MLEQFQMAHEDELRVDQQDMRDSVVDIFRAFGMRQDHAERSADVLLYADLRGIDSHGVSNMLRVYVDWMRDGTINMSPNWRTLRDNVATRTLDSDKAHGGIIGPHAMEVAIEKAKACGVGVVNVYNGGHYGAAAYTAAMALEHDMIGVSMTSGGLAMTPTHGAESLVGLNPIGFAAPAATEPPFIFDASMSGVAGNKVRMAKRLGRGVLPGWIADEDGAPIMDEREIPDGFMHLPLGGTREIGSHKGLGLAMMIEVLTSTLSGAAAGPDRRARQSHHFIAYSLESFSDADTFKADMDVYLRRLKNAKTAPNEERVRYAGLLAHETEIERRARGIPYHREVIDWFKGITAELKLKDRLPDLV